MKVFGTFALYCDMLIFSSKSMLNEEKQGTIILVNIPCLNPRCKHIAYNYHWFRGKLEKKFEIDHICFMQKILTYTY